MASQNISKAERVRMSTVFCVSLGFGSFLAIALSIYRWVSPDPALHEQYHQEVSPIASLVPALAFGTALLLNTLTLAVERNSIKMTMSLIVCYINLLACLTDTMGFLGMTPILRDPWGQGFNVTRVVMWLWTTPAMVYLLGLISDMSKKEVLTIVGTDALMLSMLICALSQPSQIVAVLFIGMAITMYAYSIRGVYRMFQAPIDSVGQSTSSYWSLQTVRAFTIIMWSGFIVLFMTTKLRLISVTSEEWAWGILDFLGKVMFSSSLLQSNFITMEERRLHAMKLVEEGRREQVIKELTSLVQQKEQFMSGMSHELRTPLNGIIGLSDAMLVGCCGDLTEVSHKTISTIKASGMRLLNLINDILDAASMQHGKLVIRQERVKLDRLVDDVMDLLKPLAKKDVKLVNDVPATIPAVLGDTGRMMQIMHNLIGNACKFTSQGSITVNAILKMDEVEVAVADTGIGIPREKFEDIFKAFEQVDMSITRQYGGTGLGLNLVKQLVAAHGGQITVKSKLNVGTTFYFSFKVWDPAVHAEDKSNVMTPADMEATKQRVGRMMSILNTQRDNSKRPVGHLGDALRTSKSLAPPSTPRAAAAAGTDVSPNPAVTGLARASVGKPTTPTARTGVPIPASMLATAETEVRELVPEDSLTGPERAASSNPALQPTLTGDGSAPATTDEGALQQPEAATPQPVKSVAFAKDTSEATVVETNQGAGAGVSETMTNPLEGELGPEGRPIHVLSVDDDDVNQMVVQNLLSSKGFRITKAMDGQEALELLQREDQLPDIILLDVMMPGMSGYEVCRKLRELYPASCVPVIMVSAKSKEEDVVEGLAVGANDYIVKPFGRQELLARVQAHLRYRTKVQKMASQGTGGGAESEKRSRMSENLVELLCASSKAFSLPPSIKSKVENSTGVSTPLQVFDDLTMIVIGITNLDALTASRSTSMPEVLGGLASLYIYLDDLLVQYNAYLVDCLEDKLVIVMGLSGDRLQEQACSAVDLAAEIQQLAATLMPGNGATRLLLSVGIHSCTATAAIVGVQHPVLQITGALADRAAQLQVTCPPGCVHVSKRIYTLCNRPSQFSPAVRMQLQSMGQDATFLHHSGPWAVHLLSMPSRFERYMAAHPFGPINSTALRLRPVQRALLSLLHADISRLVELLNANAGQQGTRSSRPKDEAARTGQDALLASTQSFEPFMLTTDMVGLGPDRAQEDSKALNLVTKLQLDKEELVKQLEQKTTETDRLQVVVDNLQLDLYGLEALQGQLESSTGELGKLRNQVNNLQAQLLAVHAMPKSGEAAVPGPPASPGTAGASASSTGILLALRGPSGSGAAPQGTGATAVGGQGAAGASSAQNSGTRTDEGARHSGTTAWLSRYNTGGLDEANAEVPPLPSITEFLASLGMPHLSVVFVREEITPDMLPYIHDATLLQLGVTSVGDLVRLRRACNQL